MSRFVDDDDDDQPSIENVVQAESEKKQIMTYGTLDVRYHPCAIFKGKIPQAVDDFILENKAPNATKTLIIARLLELGMEKMQQDLLLDNVEIKY